MRIRNSITPTTTPTSSVSHLPSPSSSSTTTAHSTISTHSLTSSSDSTSSFTSTHRCNGLDLLVKAVYHVAGSVIGVPYIQRRVIRRRKRAVKFNTFIINWINESEHNNGQVLNEVNKHRRRSNTLNDSVLQDLKTNNRRPKRSNKA